MLISISISKEDLFLIDEYCDSIGISRSKFLVRSGLKETNTNVIKTPQQAKERITVKVPTCKHGYPVHLCKSRKCRKT